MPDSCVVVTVPANKLPTDRMPPILDQSDWAKWAGEEPAAVDELKHLLRTHEGVCWKNGEGGAGGGGWYQLGDARG